MQRRGVFARAEAHHRAGKLLGKPPEIFAKLERSGLHPQRQPGFLSRPRHHSVAGFVVNSGWEIIEPVGFGAKPVPGAHIPENRFERFNERLHSVAVPGAEREMGFAVARRNAVFALPRQQMNGRNEREIRPGRVADNQRIKRLHEFGHGEGGVNAVFGFGCVRFFAKQPDCHALHRWAKLPRHPQHLMQGVARHVMQRKHVVGCEGHKTRVGQHRSRAFAGFFGGLKQQDHPARRKGCRLQPGSQSGQYSRVTVMPAFVRHPGPC